MHPSSVCLSQNIAPVGYKPLEILHESNHTLVYRALRCPDQVPVIIKTALHPASLRLADRLAFHNQFTIGHHLDHPGIIQHFSLEPCHQTYALVMEDVQGISLSEFLQGSVCLQDGLTIALQLVEVLHYLGQQRVVHKDIKPANILIHPQTLQIKLIDFGIASRLPKESQEPKNPHALEGTLAYMAPEQTGRMNRRIDFRSDFYSLGVTLFELFAGQLPLQAEEPMGWLHCHLAQVPPPLTAFGVPEAVANIVAKLLAKNAEDRYQSALGLKHDLQQCLTQLMEQGEIEPFELGKKEMCDRFLIPEKLYGREAEVQMLLEAFARTSHGNSELMLVTGFSGVGKTAVINEVHKPITQKNGYFFKGKFDQFNRNIPFSAFVQAFQGLVNQLLSESDQTLADWQTRILAAVGRNGQIVLDVIPELAAVIGDQPPAPELAGTAAQNRFKLVFSRLVQVFTAPEHPLVIFLDDLQWIDGASLSLIKTLLIQAQAGSTPGYLLLIGAYRDNEVHAGHPLLQTLHELAQQHTPMQTLKLEPLHQEDVHRFVTDTLHCTAPSPHDRARPLSELVYQKSQGNPFFTTQFLSGLQRDNYISFDPEQGHWQCDLTQVQQLALTDNIVDFLVERLQTLPPPTQEVLKFAACIGNPFDLVTLARVCDQTQEQVAKDLWPSLQAGLVLPKSQIYKFLQGAVPTSAAKTGASQTAARASARPEAPDLAMMNIGYRFLHDRVQQAAYQLIPEDQTQQVHLNIGQRWLISLPPEEQTERLFDVIGQLNRGHQLLTEDAERQTLIQLNLKAAKRAVTVTIAYDLADICLQICRELLPTDSWRTCYDLTLNIYTLSAEVAYLQGKWDAMDALALIIAQQAQDTLDTVTVCALQVEARTINGQFLEAIALGLRCLSKLGIEFPKQPDNQDFQAYFQDTQQLLAGRPATDILSVPHNSSPHHRALLQLLFKVGEAAYNAQPPLFALTSQKMVQISIVHGNMPESAAAYIGYGMILCNVLGDIDKGYRLGQAAQELMAQFQTSNHITDGLLLHHAFISHWQEPLQPTLDPLLRAYTMGVERGDLSSSGYAAHFYCSHAYFLGQELTALEVEIKHYSQAITAINQDVALGYNNILHQAVLNLLELSDHPTQWVGPAFDETIDLGPLAENQHKFGLLCFYTHQLFLFYLFEDYGYALDAYDQAHKIATSGLGTVYTSHLMWVGALTSLVLLREQPASYSSQDSELEQIVALGKEKLQLWATHNPHSYGHKYALLCAESHRLAGDRLAALEAYEQAIAGANTSGYLQDEALANELAARFYLDWGKEKIGVTYLKDAYACYAEWGANAKTQDLEQRYPQYLKSTWQKGVPLINPLETLATVASPQKSQHASHLSYTSADEINQAFDFAAILRAAQALNETIHLDEFLQNLSQIILHNSGADHLIVALPKGHDQWQVRVMATPGAINLCADALSHHPHAPVKLIQYVKNTRELVHADTLKLDLPFEDYECERPPQSFLCAPLIAQDELLGVLYLHSSSIRGLFSAERLITLNFLFSQIAIGLRNAQVFENELILKSKVIESSVDGIAILEANQFLYVNQVYAALFRYEQDELLTQGWEQLFTPAEVQRLQVSALPEVIQSGQWNGEVTALRQDRSTFDAEVSFFHLDDGRLICICRDISDRKRTEAALQLSEARATAVFTQATVGIVEANLLSGKLIRFNDYFGDLLGYSKSELHDMHLLDLTHPDDASECKQLIRALDTGKLSNFALERRFIHKNGSTVWVFVSANTVQLPHGKRHTGVAILQDISDRKAAELALQNSQAQFRRMTENVPGVIYRYVLHADGSDGFTYLSSQIWEIFEITPEIALQNTAAVWEKIHPEDVPKLQQAVQVSAETLQPLWSEHRLNLDQKGLRWVQLFAQPERADNGDVVWDGVVIDISDRKQAEQQLQKLSERLELAVESAQLGIWEWDHKANHLAWDDRMFAIYGVSPQEFEGTYEDWANCVHPEDLATLESQTLDTVNSTAPSYTQEFRVIRPDSTVRYILATASIERNHQGQPIRSVGMNLDITDRKTTELALQNSQAQFRRMTENVPGMIYRYVLHPDGRDELTYVSSQVREIYELEPKIVLQDVACLWERIHPDDVASLKVIVESSANTLQPCKGEHRLLLPQKGLRWIQFIAQPILQTNGDVVWDGVVIDISDRKTAEQAIAQQQTHLKALLNNIPHIIWLKDADGQYIAVNATYEAVCGLTMAEIVGRTDYDISPQNLARGYRKDDAQVLASGQSKMIVEQFSRADGTLGWLETTKTPFQDKQGNWVGTVGIAADITKRKEAELALQNSQAQFRRMTENVPGMIYRYVLHPDGRDEMTYVSSQVREIYELEPDKVLQDVTCLWDRVHPDDIASLKVITEHSARTLQASKGEHRLILPQKGLRWMQFIAQPTLQTNGDVIWDGVVIDISDRKVAEKKVHQINEQLIQANQDLSRATQHKDDFLASMSHELRTPLNAVLGFSQLMQRDSSISYEHHDMLDTINRNGEYLLALINDVLEISKIEAGKTTLNPKQLNLPQFLDDIREIFQFKVEAKNLTFKVIYEPNIPRYIQVDAVKLKQILLNLLSNALKFTQEGQISLHTQVLNRADPLPNEIVHLQFTVNDTGVGIAAEELDSIFQPFIQSASGKQHHQGTGLGLPISRKFSQMMGGNLQVNSILGQGSTFLCDIHVQKLPAHSEVDFPQPDQYQNIQGLKNQQSTYRILITDDNADNRALLSQMLAITGFEVRDAVNGWQAVEMNESWQPHLICMDINMPQMNGLEAAHHIQHSSWSPKIIAITASAFAEDYQAALAAGCDEFLAKPFTASQVFERIAYLLEVEFETAPLPFSQIQTSPSASREDLIQIGFRAMPIEWQQQAHQAICTLDDWSMRHLLADVPEEHQGMVDAISSLLKEYRYDILMKILDIAS